MRQLPLAISPPSEPRFSNYLPGENGEALASVRALASGASPEPIVYLWGPTGSGRTHLLRAAAAENPDLVVADDVHTLDGEAQQALFVAINHAREGGASVLAAGDAPPARLALRDDLRSRLGWGLVYHVKPLSDADKARHLSSEAARRGLDLPSEVAAFILTRLPRDLTSLNDLLDRLDRESLARKRPLTVPLVRETLADMAARAELPRQSGPA
jgi:DnaA family protein